MTAPPDFRQYRAVIIASCPRLACGADLEPDGFRGYWCPSCQEAITAQEALHFDEGHDLD